MTNEVHKLGEVLRTAREAKGVDLARVERDTKIRERYLSALEAGTTTICPARCTRAASSATTGHTSAWSRSTSSISSASRPRRRPSNRRSAAPSRPLATRRSGAFVITPGLVGAALLTVIVGGLVAWIGYQFVTFARTPELPSRSRRGTLELLRRAHDPVHGVTAPNATVTVSNLTENPTVTADETGAFEVTVELVPGSNVMQLVSRGTR